MDHSHPAQTRATDDDARHQAEVEKLHARYAGLPLAQRMANWFDLSRMFGTAKDILLSEVFRDRFDYRQLESAHSQRDSSSGMGSDSDRSSGSDSTNDARQRSEQGRFEDYSNRPECLDDKHAFWLDYAADIGDGFDSTYHVAQALAQPQLSVLPPASRTPNSRKDGTPNSQKDETPFSPALPRASLLILGGDQVYPSASRQRYGERFIKPYEAASYQPEPRPRDTLPHLFAVPGNHDWYDGLGAFMNIFAEQRAVGLWRTRQRRSYFALKLPHKWWLFAVDVALSGELDIDQVNYFEERVRKDVADGDRIILCLPEPDWAKPRALTWGSRDALCYLQRRISEAAAGRDIQVGLRIAGDLHHYRRHMSVETSAQAEPRWVPNLTAGGGGAFLHPTHDGAEHGTRLYPPGSTPPVWEFACQPSWCFPRPDVSRRLTRANWLFGLRNWRLWTSLSLLYMLVFYLWFVSFQRSGGGRTMLLGGLCALLFYGLSKLAKKGSDSVPAENLRVVPEPAEGPEHEGRSLPLSSWPATLRGVLHGLAQSTVLAFGLTGVWGFLALLLANGLGELLHGGPLPPDSLKTLTRHCLLQDAGFAAIPDFASGAMSPSSFSYAVLINLAHLLWLLLRLFVQAGITAFLSLMVFGLYLWVSLNRHRVHCNDAFAALRSPDYKNFLRICIRPEQLIVYAIGFRATPKKWTFMPDRQRQAPPADSPLFRPSFASPQEAAACAARLIEAPLCIGRERNPPPATPPSTPRGSTRRDPA